KHTCSRRQRCPCFARAGIPLPAKAGSPLPSTLMAAHIIGGVDESGVRAHIATLVDVDGSPRVADSHITSVLVEDGWLAVVLTAEDLPRELLARLHAHLRAAYPLVEVELRSGGRGFRGGDGFGPE